MKTYFLIIFTYLPLMIFAQSFELRVSYSEKLPETVENILREVSLNPVDSQEIYQLANSLKVRLYEEGYLLSSANIHTKDSLADIHLIPGPRLWWGNVSLRFSDSLILAIPQGMSLNSKIAGPGVFEHYIRTFLSLLENQGYPFAQLSFNDYRIKNDSISGNIYINPGPYTTIDSLVVKGYDKFSYNVIRYDLGFKKGMPYDESFIQRLPDLVQRVEYIAFSRAPAIAFTKKKTILYLYVEEVKSNQIDGVIGLNTEDNGDLTFTGDFQLRLLNTLKRGEEIKIRWRRPDESVSNLDVGLTFPYLFNTPFWIEGDLNIFRQDSSFVNTQSEAYLKYLIESGNFLSVGIDYRSSNVLTESASDNPLSSFNSFKTTSYKIGYERNATNRVIVPQRGNNLRAYVLTGNRKTTNTTQKQYGWEFFDEQYFLLFRNHVIKLAALSEALFGESLFENELFRIGGLKTLRGFNEQSIYASSYGIGSLEYRYMIGEYDYLALFSDIAYVENNSLNSFSSNYFIGLGTGLNFRTKGGIFSLFFAIGRDDQNPFDFQTTKIHFGYVNRF